MITAVSADGTDVRAFDEGHGPVILIIHPGLDDGRSWQKVARRLAGRFRVVRIVRRHYRVDIPAASCYSMAKEVEDVLALAELLGEPIVIVGHSSGAVVALEALAAAPATFAGADRTAPSRPRTQSHPSSGPAVAALPFAASRSRNGPTRSPSWAVCRNRWPRFTEYRVRRPVRVRVR
jgi:pimeloyl-ACP methyl ester carboxylesterase